MENIEGERGGAGRAEDEGREVGGPEGEVGRGAPAVARADAWVSRRLLYLSGGAVVVGVLFSVLQFSTRSICCGDFDGYYHVGWSRMLWDGLRRGMFPPPFTQLPLTTLNPQDYVDHHFLFHLLQIPAQWFADPVVGAKVLTALFASAAVFACYWLVVRYRLRYPLMWLVALLACSAPFLYRMNMAKAMSVTLVLLVAGIYFLFERRYLLLLPLSFVFALTYDLWVLLGVAAGAWAVVVSWGERRIEWRAVAACGYVLAGGILGYVINPYFPHNLELFAEHFVMKVRGGDFSTAVGGEWYPYNTWEFLTNSVVACMATVVGYVAFDWRDRKASARALFLLLFTTVLLVANLRWKRFAEYWPPFAVLFAAFSVQAALDAARSAAGRLPAEVLDELQPYLDRNERPADVRERSRWREYALAAVVSVYLVTQAVGNAVVTAKDIAGSAPPDHYRGGINWLKANVAPGEMVFNTDWDDFPRLFYFAPEFRYVSGLDPTYLQDQNPELHKLYEEITTGRHEDPGPLIRERFNARYVFTDNEHEDFVNLALDSGWFDEPVYEDEDCTVLRLRDAKGDRPPAPAGDDQPSHAPPDEEP